MIDLSFPSLLALGEHLTLQAALGEVTQMKHALAQGAALIREDAEDQIGHYQNAVGNYPAWEPLAESTEDEKARLGAPADAPLERFGDLKDSFRSEVVSHEEAIVGSIDPVMTYHEFGTSKMPPRPVFGPALLKNIDAVLALTGAAALNATVVGQHLGYRFNPKYGIGDTPDAPGAVSIEPESVSEE